MPRRLLLAVCALALVPILSACGDDDDDDSGSGATTSATAALSAVPVSSAVPNLSGPASKYSVDLDDLGLAWFTDIAATFVIDSASYGQTPRLFSNEQEGRRLLKDWGYLEGYETAYIPEGRDKAVLNGSFYIVLETHRFESAEGARKAYDHFVKYRTQSGASPVEVEGVGNEAAGFVTVTGKISGSQVNAAFHQVVFVRGNVLMIVLTKGSQTLMKIDPARDIAQVADEKMLGDRPAVEPTPISNFQTPTPGAKP